MPRVAWLFEYATLNGGERSLLATLGAVRTAGFDVVAVAPPKGPLAARLCGCTVPMAPFLLFKMSGGRRSRLDYRWQLADRLRRERPDLVHANSLAMGRLVGPVARELGIPSIAHLRDIVGLSRAAVGELNCHERLLAVSVATREFHVAQGVAAEKTFVAYNGVDLDCFRPRAPTGWLHRELGLDPAAPLVGAIGQIILRKGLDVLLAAVATLLEWHPDMHVVVAGENYSRKAEASEFEHRLHRVAGSPPLAGRVHFLGGRDDVERLLPELSLLVHAARQEPLGRVLLEAAACGMPIVATDVGGTREIFPPDAQAARLVPPDDAQALADAVAALLQDAPLRSRLGAAARHRVEEQFTAAHAAEELLVHYREVVDGPTAV